MLTTDVLRRGLAGDGEDRVLTLDPGFQGLPETAHGGSVLAAFDLAGGHRGPRDLHGHYLKRVSLGVALDLRVRRSPDDCRLELSDHGAVLVTGRVAEAVGAAVAPARGDGAGIGGGELAPPPAPDAMALPISRGCFACGVDNPLGLGLQLRADTAAVGGTWTPPARFRAVDGTVATLALTTLLDEAAFWLGALATGESGMTTELRVRLHGDAPAGGAITVAGARAAARPRAGDARYWDTEVAACDGDGRLVAGAAITFVAIRGAARRLVTGMLAVNAADVLRRVFPAYAPPA